MKYTLLIVLIWPLCVIVKAHTTVPPTHIVNEHTIAEPPKKPIKTIGILLYDGYTTLDAMGPHQVLSELMGTKVFFVAKQKGIVSTTNGLKVTVDRSFADTDSLDILLIPGGFAGTYQTSKDPETLDWIRKIDRTTVYTTSVCTGAWILAATGLLNGKNATTHWYGKPVLQELGAKPQNERWVRDGKYWTSAGVTAGMDMSLALINDIKGEQYTRAAMLDMEYDPKPPFSGGSEQNTEKSIVDMMRQMYDAGLARGKVTPVPVQNPVTKSVKKPVRKSAVRSKASPKIAQVKHDKSVSGLLSGGIDPVCQMSVPKGTALTASHKGHQYGFCSELCKDRFMKNPAQYVTK